MSSPPLPPGGRIGILGGGQLGRMLALAAARLGFDTVVLSPRANAPDARVAADRIEAAYDDVRALAALAARCDLVTFEFENVPVEALRMLEDLGTPVRPGPRALETTQDRVVEKRFLRSAGIATVDFAPVSAIEDIVEGLDRLGAPALLKTRREGYDGKGQTWVRSAVEAPDRFASIGGAAAILEARADFVREISVVAARGLDGSIRAYPIGENHHEDGILRTTLAPAPGAEALQSAAEAIAVRVLEGLSYVGVLAVELFDMGDGLIWANEIAPRVHNSGHWTQDGAASDQFEQHIRAIAGWPLAPTHALARTRMQNLIGAEVEAWAQIAADADARLHLYGKGEARPGRKMGHVNRRLGPA